MTDNTIYSDARKVGDEYFRLCHIADKKPMAYAIHVPELASALLLLETKPEKSADEFAEWLDGQLTQYCDEMGENPLKHRRLFEIVERARNL